MLSVPRLLVAGPELVGQFKGGRPQDRNIQDPFLGIILIILSLRWAGCGPTAVCWLLALNCDRFTPCRRMACAHAMEITCVQLAWDGGHGDSARLTEGPVPGAQAGA